MITVRQLAKAANLSVLNTPFTQRIADAIIAEEKHGWSISKRIDVRCGLILVPPNWDGDMDWLEQIITQCFVCPLACCRDMAGKGRGRDETR